MKFFCIILSVYIVVLSIKPCCTDYDCQAARINKKELAAEVPVKDKECAGCSPFFSCGTCAGSIITNPFTFKLKDAGEILVNGYAAYQQPRLQQIPLSIWQPPQIG